MRDEWRWGFDQVGLFWDFGSLYQPPRVGDQEELFKQDQKAEALEAAWDINQRLLAADGTNPKELQAGLTNAVRLLPQVKEKLGSGWIRRSFTKDVVRGREVMAAIGSTVAANRARGAKKTDLLPCEGITGAQHSRRVLSGERYLLMQGIRHTTPARLANPHDARLIVVNPNDLDRRPKGLVSVAQARDLFSVETLAETKGMTGKASNPR